MLNTVERVFMLNVFSLTCCVRGNGCIVYELVLQYFV